MFDSPSSAGTAQTTAVALLAVAFIFIPAVLVVSRSFGYISPAGRSTSGTVQLPGNRQRRNALIHGNTVRSYFRLIHAIFRKV